ncbi:large ribosomal RNA subunit accumulation protein YCED homolog 2, chloroplastic isoform X2 [Amborella trichopoda]|nr:large ribosomal RNA subunit accumulation protein YCED homolog 2, chloroplastic isoform X2 [Amborella trichopoda]|eukprot:XP_006847876.2 large ribosomal RNA subunit accumulation protein YCED homolog 2, chloroplastic isoform X2 [Amborella trichopoda]
MTESLLYTSKLVYTVQSPIKKFKAISHTQFKKQLTIARSSRLAYSYKDEISDGEAWSNSDNFIRKNKSKNMKKILRKSSRPAHNLISISTADGRWHGQWTCHYIFSLEELELADLAEEGEKGAEVMVSLSIQKHVGFGYSIDGRITTCFTRKCSNCLSPYCKEIDTHFNVWVLPSSKENHSLQLPEIGGDDPSVIYINPRSPDADLDSLVKDTIRLSTSGVCSESCERSPQRWECGDPKEGYTDRRWSKLLQIKVTA